MIKVSYNVHKNAHGSDHEAIATSLRMDLACYATSTERKDVDKSTTEHDP